MLKSVNPHDGGLIKTYQEHSAEQLADIINKSNTAYQSYSAIPFSDKKRWLHNAAFNLRARKVELGQLMTLEMGKPILQAYAEIEKCAWVCEYYADNAESFLSDEKIKTDASNSYVSYRPLGIILAVMPWNFPFWQVFRFAAPTLMAGNTALLKHSSNVCGCALAIEDIFRESGMPPDVFKTVLIPGKDAELLISDKTIKAVSLTGSTTAGISVAQSCGKYLKKCVLELGGSDPYIILDDADIESAAETCVNSRLINGGQSCIAAKRFIVTENRYNEFCEALIACMRTKKMGDPANVDNHLGPQARTDLRDELHAQVIKTLNQGGKAALGCEPVPGPGAYYPPSVILDVKPEMTAFSEELFGPVAPITRAKDEIEAVQMANNSDFGLGAAIFTKDIERGEYLAKHLIESGSCFVNAFVKSDPRLPFGGIKLSGYGRELALFGIREFVNIKSIYIK